MVLWAGHSTTGGGDSCCGWQVEPTLAEERALKRGMKARTLEDPRGNSDEANVKACESALKRACRQRSLR